jgi:hypothetical protein
VLRSVIGFSSVGRCGHLVHEQGASDTTDPAEPVNSSLTRHLRSPEVTGRRVSGSRK